LKPLRHSANPQLIDVDSLVVDALRCSPHIRAISDKALIAKTAITESEAEFDVKAFIDSKFVRTSVPTGSVLDAGFDVSRLREEDYYYSAGVRRKNGLGGRFELAQRVGTRQSNSNFFFPEEQGNAQLTLSYTQPVLNGAGRTYNNSLIVLATIETHIAASRGMAEVQDHLLEVADSFWELHVQRVTQLQKRRHLERAKVILDRLESRRNVDALESQIARARAAVEIRRADLIRAAAGSRNAEARVRSLVSSPALLCDRDAELIPARLPACDFVDVDLKQALVTALQHRPEIDAASREIKAASVRLRMAENELRPVLDFVLETYVSGLRGDYDVPQSMADQFSRGEPSYSVGIIYEMPLGNRAASARCKRRQLECRQLASKLEAAVQTLHAEVEIAVNDVRTSYRHLEAKRQSMTAAIADVRYLQNRWELVPGEDRAASFLLEDLLDAQDRLAFEEAGFAQARADCARALLRLKRATGTLFRCDVVQPPRS
jgi:outer membrane protein TolC